MSSHSVATLLPRDVRVLVSDEGVVDMSKVVYMCNECKKFFPEKGPASGLSAGKALAGGVLLGPVGAVAGAAMGKRQRNSCCPYCGSYRISRV